MLNSRKEIIVRDGQTDRQADEVIYRGARLLKSITTSKNSSANPKPLLKYVLSDILQGLSSATVSYRKKQVCSGYHVIIFS